MRIRPSIFRVSSVLLTLGFLWLLPSTINCVRSRDSMIQIAGLAFLTLIIVALIVIWTGVAGELGSRGSQWPSSSGSGRSLP
jgi:hypothetical protein